MRGAKLLAHVRQALANLNPAEVRAAAAIPVRVVIDNPDPRVRSEIERILIPDNVLPRKRAAAQSAIGEASGEANVHVSASPGGASAVVAEMLDAYPQLHLALARTFPGIRKNVSDNLVLTVAKENATFALATALPSMVPVLSLPVAVGEFASDTAFLTMNQIRLAFLLAGASGRKVGYRDQKSEIASIIAGAFGWRALARELVGQVPFGGGVLPKAAIAFAGTFAVGASLERYYRVGYGYSPTEREQAYRSAFERGKTIAGTMLEAHRRRRTSSLQ